MTPYDPGDFFYLIHAQSQDQLQSFLQGTSLINHYDSEKHILQCQNTLPQAEVAQIYFITYFNQPFKTFNSTHSFKQKPFNQSPITYTPFLRLISIHSLMIYCSACWYDGSEFNSMLLLDFSRAVHTHTHTSMIQCCQMWLKDICCINFSPYL